MRIRIDTDLNEPIFSQIVQQVKSGVERDELTPGAALPSIRQLARDLEVNSKTVAKAYQLLERDSIIQAKGYRGTFVHPDAKTNCATNVKAIVVQSLSESVAACKAAGATDSEIRITFGQIMSEGNV